MNQHGTERRILERSVKRGGKHQLEMITYHFGLRVRNFWTMWGSILVNTAYAFINNLDPQMKTLLRHKAKEARKTVGISYAVGGKIFLKWEVIYGNPVHDVNNQTKGLRYKEPTRTDPNAKKKLNCATKENATLTWYLYTMYTKPLECECQQMVYLKWTSAMTILKVARRSKL